MAINREQLISAALASVPYDVVTVPEWGGEIRLKGLDFGQRQDLRVRVLAAMRANDDAALVGVNTTLVMMSMVDDAGAQLLSGEADVEVLQKFHPLGFDAVLNAAKKLNVMSESDEKDPASPQPGSEATAN